MLKDTKNQGTKQVFQKTNENMTKEFNEDEKKNEKNVLISSVINSMEGNSTSNRSMGSHGTLANSLTLKKRINSLELEKSYYFFILFNVLVIILSIICLTYGKSLNDIFSETIELYRVSFSINRQALMATASLFSLLCTEYDPISREGQCISQFEQYISQLNVYPDLTLLTEYYFVNVVNEFSTSYLNLKKLIDQSGNKELKNVLDKPL
jgi:hypothetical protein